LLTFGGLLAPTFGGALTYASSAAWLAAGPSSGSIDFSAQTGPYTSPFTVAPLTFSALLGSTIGIGSAFGPGTGKFAYTLTSMQISPTTPGAIYGLGFNLGCYISGCSSAQSIVVTDTSNNVFTYTNIATPGFWGVRSDVAIASIRITLPTTNDYVAIDDVSYGGQAQSGGGGGTAPGDTPEAATLILIGTGLALIARYRRYACFHAASV
jgi:hypothetical protein